MKKLLTTVCTISLDNNSLARAYNAFERLLVDKGAKELSGLLNRYYHFEGIEKLRMDYNCKLLLSDAIKVISLLGLSLACGNLQESLLALAVFLYIT